MSALNYLYYFNYIHHDTEIDVRPGYDECALFALFEMRMNEQRGRHQCGEHQRWMTGSVAVTGWTNESNRMDWT